MVLNNILKNVKPLHIIGNDEIKVTGVNIDSRRVKEGNLFIAMKGTQMDGHQFLDKAIELGAQSVLCEEIPQNPVDGVT